MKRQALLLCCGGALLIILGIALGLLIPRLLSSKAEEPDPEVLAEIQRLEARSQELLSEHAQLARDAEVQGTRLRSTSSSGSSSSVLNALDDMQAASDRRLRSQDIMAELIRIEERIKELSGDHLPSEDRE